MLRVDHAGEVGAVALYRGMAAGQASKMAPSTTAEAQAETQAMLLQEQRHRDLFESLLADHGVRVSLLTPLWRLAGFLAGYGMARANQRDLLTVAVEDEIIEHYQHQIDQVEAGFFAAPRPRPGGQTGLTRDELRRHLVECRDDELAHRDQAEAHLPKSAGAAGAAGSSTLYFFIRRAIRGCIWCATRV